MDNPNPIKYSDLIQPDNSIQQLIDQLEEAIKVYGEMKTAIQSDAAALVKSMQSVSGATDDQRQVIQQTAQQAEQLAEQMRSVRDAEIKATNDLNVAKAANKEYNQLLKLQAELSRSQEGSYNRLSAQYRINKIRLNEMSQAERETTESGKKLEAETRKIYEEMSRLQKATGKYTLEVGHYENALKAIPGPLGKVIGIGTQWRDSMTQTKNAVSGLAGSLGMSTGGLMATIGLVSAGVAGIIGAFKLWTNSAHETQTAGDALDFAMAELNATVSVLKKSISTWDFSNLISQLRNATTSARELKMALDDAFERRQSIRIQKAQQAEENAILLETMRNQKLSYDERLEAGKKYLANVQPIYEQEQQLAEQLYRDNLDALFDLTNKRKFASDEQKEAAKEAFAAGLDEFNLNYDKIKQAREYLKAVDDLTAAEKAYQGASGATEKIYQQQIKTNREVIATTDDDIKKMAEFVKRHELTSDEELQQYYDFRDSMLLARSAYHTEERRIITQVNSIDKKRTEESNGNTKKRVSNAEDEVKAKERLAAEEEKLLQAEAKRRADAIKAEQDAWIAQLNKERETIQLQIDATEEGSQERERLRINMLYKQWEIEIALNNAKTEEMRQDEALINAKWNKAIHDQRVKAGLETATDVAVESAKAVTKAKKRTGGDLIDLIFGTKDGEQGEKLEGIKDALRMTINSVMDSVSSLISSWEQAGDAAVAAAEKQVESAQKVLDAEREAHAQGYANNVRRAEQELALAKKTQAKAQKQKEDAQKAQLAIDSITQASSLVTASAEIWQSLGGIPVVGPALAAAAITLMFGTFLAAKIKAAQVSKETYGEGHVEMLEGGSHASGHDISLGRKADGTERRAEGGEFFAVINKRNSRRYRDVIPDVINAFNDGTFAEKYQRANESLAGYAVNLIGADLSHLEKGVDTIAKQGEERRMIEGGYVVVRYKNLTRRYKS